MNNSSTRSKPAFMLVVLCVCFLMLFHPTDAFATWPFHESRPYGLLFGEKYATPSGSQNNHGGLDILAEPGSVVVSPVSGQVSFVGRVPAGEGATQLAVSLQLDDGRIVSLMPLEVTSVGKGQYVNVGASVGTLAATGDRSSATPHLHIGLRSGNLYLDPMAILVAPSLKERPADPPVPVTTPTQVPATGGASVAAVPTIATQGSSAQASATAEGAVADITASAAAQIDQRLPVTAPNLLRIPETTPQHEPAVSVTTLEYSGDRKLLDGIQGAVATVSTQKAAVTGALSVTAGLVGMACLARSVRRSATTKQKELPMCHPAEEQVAAASGQW